VPAQFGGKILTARTGLSALTGKGDFLSARRRIECPLFCEENQKRSKKDGMQKGNEQVRLFLPE
jgi:hypothetical protein